MSGEYTEDLHRHYLKLLRAEVDMSADDFDGGRGRWALHTIESLEKENAALKADHEKAVAMVIAASIATGHADTSADLMAEVLHKVGELREENAALLRVLKENHIRLHIGKAGTSWWVVPRAENAATGSIVGRDDYVADLEKENAELREKLEKLEEELSLWREYYRQPPQEQKGE